MIDTPVSICMYCSKVLTQGMCTFLKEPCETDRSRLNSDKSFNSNCANSHLVYEPLILISVSCMTDDDS